MRWLAIPTFVLAVAALAVWIREAILSAERTDRSPATPVMAAEPDCPEAPEDATERYSRDAEQAAKSKRAQIRAEVETLGAHPWAGEYYSGDGLGANIVVHLAPEAGYVFEWHGCLGLYGRNYGSVSETDGKLTLTFEFENAKDGVFGIAPQLVPVRWGERRYLIPADDLIGFCNRVNQGAEPRTGAHGFYLLRLGDEGKAVTDRPNIPPEFQGYLLAQPVEATVAAVGASVAWTGRGGWEVKETRLTLDAGAKKGLKVGMELFVTEPDRTRATVKITAVQDDQSEAVLTQMIEVRPVPEVGWRVSTRGPWHGKPN